MTAESLRADGRGLVDGPYAWFRLGVSVLLGTIASVGMWSVIVVLPYVQAEFGVDRASASLPYTATMIGFGVGNVIDRPPGRPFRHHGAGDRRGAGARRRLRAGGDGGLDLAARRSSRPA